MTRIKMGVVAVALFVAFQLIIKADVAKVSAQNMDSTKLRFEVSLPSGTQQPLDGRLLLLISTSNEKEPRFQINEDLNTQQVFGVDVEGWKKVSKTVDEKAFGYPRRSLSQVPPGEYWVQALLHVYETF